MKRKKNDEPKIPASNFLLNKKTLRLLCRQKILKVKSPHQQIPLYTTENTAPETPRQ